MTKETEIQAMIEGRARLFQSAKISNVIHDVSRKEWITNHKVIELAKRYNVEDELVHIANFVWGEEKEHKHEQNG